MYKLVSGVTFGTYSSQWYALERLPLQSGPVLSMSPKTLTILLNAMIMNRVTVGIFESAPSSRIEDVNLWLMKTKNFPGPEPTAVPGNKSVWAHACNLDTILGVMRAGVIFPTTSDGVMLPESILLTGFFGRAKWIQDDSIGPEQEWHLIAPRRS